MRKYTRQRKLTTREVERVCRRREKGESYRAIAVDFGISFQEVGRVLLRAGRDDLCKYSKRDDPRLKEDPQDL
jgi:DNA invertase Pin-like site-specific DNA recombinase